MRSRRAPGSTLARATALMLAAVIAGTGPVTAAPPGNDDRGSATVVGGLPFRDRVDTSEATPQLTDPECASEGDNHSVWYSFTPATSGTYLARTAKPEFYATLTLARLRSGGGLSIIECQDFGWNDVIWEARAGTTYMLMIGSAYGEPGGRVVFRVMKAPRPPTISVDFSGRPKLTRSGWVIVEGTVRCSRSGYADVRAKARQEWRRFIIRADRYKSVTCGSTWRMALGNPILKYGPGKVRIRLDAVTCNMVGCASDRLVRRFSLER